MNPKRAFAVTRRIFQGLRHDRRTLGLALFAPILAMLVFGTAFSGDVHNVRVLVISGDDGFVLNVTQARSLGLDPAKVDFVWAVNASYVRVNLAQGILGRVGKGDVIDLKSMQDQGEAVDMVRRGEAWAVLSFPENFTRDVFGKALDLRFPSFDPQKGGFGNNTTMRLQADESSVNVASTIRKEISGAIQSVMEDMNANLPLEVDSSEPIYGENASFIDFFVPGIMALAIFMLTTLLTLLSFVGEKSSGTLERLQASPLTEGELVAGYAMAFGLLGMVQAGILMTVALVVFHITIVGNPVLAFVVVALLAVVSQNLGILLSSAARTEAQAVQFIPIIILPTFLLAGIFWPVEAIPGWLQPVSYFLPPTYAVEALRSVLLRGHGVDKIMFPELTALLLFAALFLLASVGLLKRRRG